MHPVNHEGLQVANGKELVWNHSDSLHLTRFWRKKLLVSQLRTCTIRLRQCY